MTKLFGVLHGRASSLCLSILFPSLRFLTLALARMPKTNATTTSITTVAATTTSTTSKAPPPFIPVFLVPIQHHLGDVLLHLPKQQHRQPLRMLQVRLHLLLADAGRGAQTDTERGREGPAAEVTS